MTVRIFASIGFFVLFLVACSEKASEQQTTEPELDVSLSCSPGQLKPGESARILARVTRESQPTAGELVVFGVGAVIQVAGDSEAEEDRVGTLVPAGEDTVTDEHGKTEATFTAGRQARKVAITAQTVRGRSRDSCNLEIVPEEQSERLPRTGQLSIFCDPLAGVGFGREGKEGTVTVELHRSDGSPVAGKEVELIFHRARKTRPSNERLKVPRPGPGSFPTGPGGAVGALGRLRTGELPPPEPPITLVTDEHGQAQDTYSLRSLLKAIRAKADGEKAACV